MNRTESASSITSMMVNVNINEERRKLELESENLRLRDIVHEQTAMMTHYRDQSARFKDDAARWVFAKQRYCKQLGFETPRDLQEKVDTDMRAVEVISDSVLNRVGKK